MVTHAVGHNSYYALNLDRYVHSWQSRMDLVTFLISQTVNLWSVEGQESTPRSKQMRKRTYGTDPEQNITHILEHLFVTVAVYCSSASQVPHQKPFILRRMWSPGT